MMMISSFVVSAMVLLWVPLCDALMHAGQLETLRRGVVEHQHESNASDSIPPAPGMTGMWVAKSGDMHRTGSSHSVAPRDLASGPSWRWGAQAIVVSTPLIDEEQNIISSAEGAIIKFSRDGHELWRYFYDGGLDGGELGLNGVPALADGAIYAIAFDGTLISLDAHTGKLLWQSQVGNCSSFDAASVLVTEGVVVAGVGRSTTGGATTVVAASVADGHEVWRLDLNGTYAYNFMASAHNGSIIFQSAFGDVYRISAADGTVIWRQPGIVVTEGASPQAAQAFSTAGAALDMDGNIYASFNRAWGQGMVKALSFGDGQVLWERHFPLEANAAAAVGNLDGTRGGPLAVFVALGSNPERAQYPAQQPNRTVEGKAVALNAVSGETIWELTLPEWRGPAAGDVHPYHVVWPDQFGNAAVDGNGTAYFARASGRIYAVHDDNHDGELSEELGEVSWFNSGDGYQSAPAISDGMLAVSPDDGLMVFLSNAGSAQL